MPSVKTLVSTVRTWLDAHETSSSTLAKIILVAQSESHFRLLAQCMHQYFPVKSSIVAQEVKEGLIGDDDSEFVGRVLHSVTVADGIYTYGGLSEALKDVKPFAKLNMAPLRHLCVDMILMAAAPLLLKHLRTLDVSQCEAFTDYGMELIIKHCDSLQSVRFSIL